MPADLRLPSAASALWTAVSLLLLLAGGHVATLQLARVEERQRELATRRAIGVNRRHLMARQA